MVSVGDLIKVKRQQAGISARDLSIRIGRSPSYISKVELGSIDPTLNSFALIAAELNMNHLEIMTCLGVEVSSES